MHATFSFQNVLVDRVSYTQIDSIIILSTSFAFDSRQSTLLLGKGRLNQSSHPVLQQKSELYLSVSSCNCKQYEGDTLGQRPTRAALPARTRQNIVSIELPRNSTGSHYLLSAWSLQHKLLSSTGRTVVSNHFLTTYCTGIMQLQVQSLLRQH